MVRRKEAKLTSWPQAMAGLSSLSLIPSPHHPGVFMSSKLISTFTALILTLIQNPLSCHVLMKFKTDRVLQRLV